MPEHYQDEMGGYGDELPMHHRPKPFSQVMENVVNRLESEARERISRRRLVEERWLSDIAQFEGRDDQDRIADLVRAQRSTAVTNVTRPKCNTSESKVFDLLFPTDDRNWGIGPTPVAEEERDLKQIGRDIETLTVAANASPTPEKARRTRGGSRRARAEDGRA